MSDKNTKIIDSKNDKYQTAGKQIMVMGLGNVLLQDEGIGVHIVRRLKKYNLPENITLIDAGTATLDALLIHPDISTLIVIDAAETSHKSGTICKTAIKTSEISKMAENPSHHSQVSLHQMGLIQALTIAKKIGRAPTHIRIIAVQPEKIVYSLEPTKTLKNRIPEIIKTVMGEINDALHTE